MPFFSKNYTVLYNYEATASTQAFNSKTIVLRISKKLNEFLKYLDKLQYACSFINDFTEWVYFVGLEKPFLEFLKVAVHMKNLIISILNYFILLAKILSIVIAPSILNAQSNMDEISNWTCSEF